MANVSLPPNAACHLHRPQCSTGFALIKYPLSAVGARDHQEWHGAEEFRFLDPPTISRPLLKQERARGWLVAIRLRLALKADAVPDHARERSDKIDIGAAENDGPCWPYRAITRHRVGKKFGRQMR
jgi:hypothetical protein